MPAMNQSLIAQCINTAHAANAKHDYQTAIWWSRQAIQVNPNLPEAWFNLGIALGGAGDRGQAIEALKKAAAGTMQSADAQNSIGLQFLELQADELAQQCLERSIALAPDYAFPYVNLGKLRTRQGRLDESLNCFKKAIERQPDLAPAHANLGGVLNDQKRFSEAEDACRRALDIDPQLPEAWGNLGVALSGRNRHQAAEEALRKAIALNAHLPEVWSNLGKLLSGLKRHDAAEAACRRATTLDPLSFEAWSNLGAALWGLRRYVDAAACFDRSLTLNPQAPYLEGYALYMRMMACDWTSLAEQRQGLIDKVRQRLKVTTPFHVLALTDDLEIQRQVAEIYTADQYPADAGAITATGRTATIGKIRIGYFSGDFRDHPVANLLVQALELHDRDRFEVVGFSLAPAREDEVRKRVVAAFDRFVDVSGKSDAETAALARELGIDIAIDLAGFTEDSRTGVFALRAAPVQASYIGYLGTMGAPYIDYLIADRTIVPVESRSSYTEKIAYLRSYQANDASRRVADKTFSREELGLPPSGFVFCCFNNNYKISPEVFDAWMRILRRVDESVLFLYAENPEAAKNMRREALLRGVNAGRLVFAERIERSLYLARYRAADLFLDTFPYNAGTTASDALWAGLPVLTCQGKSFASRVAASLLTAVGLPELITSDAANYENLAVELAANPLRLQELKQQLNQNRSTTPLFDTRSFTRDLERTYQDMHERFLAGLPTDHIEAANASQ